MSARVFISHSDKDKTFAEMLLSALESRGAVCWIAPRDIPPGGSYADAIMQAIEDCSCFVLVYTAQANTSPHVLREVERALKFGNNIIPVRLDQSEPSRSLDYLLATVQWLSIDTSSAKAVDRAAEQIAACVASPESRPATSPVAPVLASTPVAASAASPRSSSLRFGLALLVIALAVGGALWLGQWLTRKPKPNNSAVASPAATSSVLPSETKPELTQPVVSSPISPSLVVQAPAMAVPSPSLSPTFALKHVNEEPPVAPIDAGVQDTLRRYFACFGERNPTSAYALLSTSFHSNMSYRKYSAMFATTRAINLLEASSTQQSDNYATVAVKFEEVDADYHKAYWEGPIDLVREAGEWRIKGLGNLKKVQTPGGARLPEKRWDRPHIYLQLANDSQMKAGAELKRRLTQSGYQVVEVQKVSGEVDIPSEASEIRYFDPKDAVEAQSLANEMQSFFGNSGVITSLPEGMPYVSHSRQYEVWFSSAFH